ncbi:hypothetical protein OE88DRAFT_1666226 [Heliocybe sulcata]|uniref:Uncharacterized protein n=1 Tax=Heliocybe sulcata TaxID=5364 RepID=A0A5C3MPW1_9AGAM|nr:hypothetical protein OE88DRAFT_1666226 [Heliocybe sulcata]
MSTEQTPGSTAGASIANKVKGVFTATHGAGESLRGNTLDAVDTAFGTRKTDNVAATRQGEAEVQQGVANMDNKYGAQTGTTGATGANTTTAGQTGSGLGSGPGTAGTY